MQIRTREMHQRAEWGVAAHWAYKDDSPSNDIDWLNRIIDWQAEVSDPAQFMQSLKTDLEQDEVFVFTPKGRVVTLPVGSTTVDFAYAVHTEVGHACIGAKVNGRLVSLDHTLSSGDTCEIFTSKVETAGPSQDWLGFVKSPRARNKIRQWFSRERRLDMIEQGRDELAEELRREGLPVQRMWSSDQLKAVIVEFSYVDLDALLAAIGEHHVSARGVAQRVARGFRGGDDEEQLPATVLRPRRHRTQSDKLGVHVEGLDDVLVRLAQCCTPVPGDDIIGFVTRGRGVSVHRADCANAVTLMSDHATRMIDVDWDGETSRLDVPRRRRGRRPRPLAAAARRGQRPVGPPRQHRRLRHQHRQRPGRQDALRVRARRPRPPGGRAAHDQGHRRRLRRLPPRARRLADDLNAGRRRRPASGTSVASVRSGASPVDEDGCRRAPHGRVGSVLEERTVSDVDPPDPPAAAARVPRGPGRWSASGA